MEPLYSIQSLEQLKDICSKSMPIVRSEFQLQN
jgi:hypothetical protein